MPEWLVSYGFFVLVVLLMFACNVAGHGGHHRHIRRHDDEEAKKMNALNWKVMITILGLTLLFGVGSVYAQSAVDPHHPPAAASAPTAGDTPAPQGGGTMLMMDMCRQMMAGPVMAMGGDPKMDPKIMAHMLQMRGEMMKVMGEVMMKHGRMMQGGTTK